jgi:hypothetical protein
MIIKYKLKNKKNIVIICLDGVEYLFYFFNNLVSEFSGECHVTIVLRPDPVQGPGFGFWPGHLVSRVSFFLKKSKWHRFNKKKKKVNGFATGSCRVNQVTSGFSFSYFFFNPVWFQLLVGRIPGQPAGPGRISKLYMSLWTESFYKRTPPCLCSACHCSKADPSFSRW